ncbi:MAG TPA: PIG-L family deacetylase [Terriglobales bacterium]|nr:PIG-L family deacetylase [Terriglobales bacterium]
MFRMLAVTAHPDDEAACFGGSLRLYSDRGVETSVVCLTPGQAARNRGSARDDQELAALRRKEFAEACAILHVSRSAVLDYPDGQLHRIEIHRPVADLVRHIRQFRPQVVLSMGPEGAITGHTDHSMAGMFTTLAFHWAARKNRFPDQLSDGLPPHVADKLYYCTAPEPLPNREPVCLPPPTARIDIGRYLDAKIAAFHAHRTQAPLFPFFDAHVGRLGSPELFHLVACGVDAIAGTESDLFEGVAQRQAA